MPQLCLRGGLAGAQTVDVDLYRAVALDIAENELRAAATIDLGDWFTFEIGPIRPAGDRGAARRLPVTARIGAAPWGVIPCRPRQG